MRLAISFLLFKNFQLFVKKKWSLFLPRSGYIPIGTFLHWACPVVKIKLLRLAVFFMTPQFCGSLQGFALFHIISAYKPGQQCFQYFDFEFPALLISCYSPRDWKWNPSERSLRFENFYNSITRLPSCHYHKLWHSMNKIKQLLYAHFILNVW